MQESASRANLTLCECNSPMHKENVQTSVGCVVQAALPCGRLPQGEHGWQPWTSCRGSHSLQPPASIPTSLHLAKGWFWGYRRVFFPSDATDCFVSLTLLFV